MKVSETEWYEMSGHKIQTPVQKEKTQKNNLNEK
jgi:hypothetical protein